MEHNKMFENLLKCQKSKFWAQNLILDAISNWILKKYSEAVDCTLVNHHDISVYFYNPKPDHQDEIINNICEEFNLSIQCIEQGCRLNYNEDNVKKFRRYILKGCLYDKKHMEENIDAHY